MFSDDIFGSMFDFNGDGVTDIAEEAVGLCIFDEMFSDGEDDTCEDDLSDKYSF